MCMKEYTAVVTLAFTGNYMLAENKEHYIQKLIGSFKDEFGIDVLETEITEIQECEVC